MPVLNQVLVGNSYPTATGAGNAILTNVYNSRGGWFSVQGATAFAQLQYGKQGDDHWTEEVLLGNGAFVTLPTNCIGVRFRNGVANVIATVTAQLAQGNEPPLAIASIGSVTLSVASLNFQHNAVAIATEPTLDFEDGNLVFSVVDDPANTRVKVSGTALMPAGRVFQPTTTVVTVPNATFTTIPCVSTSFTRGGFAQAGNGLQVPTTGLYLVSYGLGSMNGVGNAPLNGSFAVQVLGGVNVPIARLTQATGYPQPQGSDIVSVNAGATLTIQGWQNTGGNVFSDPSNGNVLGSWISAVLL